MNRIIFPANKAKQKCSSIYADTERETINIDSMYPMKIKKNSSLFELGKIEKSTGNNMFSFDRTRNIKTKMFKSK